MRSSCFGSGTFFKGRVVSIWRRLDNIFVTAKGGLGGFLLLSIICFKCYLVNYHALIPMFVSFLFSEFCFLASLGLGWVSLHPGLIYKLGGNEMFCVLVNLSVPYIRKSLSC